MTAKILYLNRRQRRITDYLTRINRLMEELRQLAEQERRRETK